jgi:hypothetical protein
MIIIDLLVEVVGYTTAKFVLPALTCGKLYVQPIKSSARGFNAIGIRPDRFGKIEVEALTAAWIGGLFWISLFILIFYLV